MLEAIMIRNRVTLRCPECDTRYELFSVVTRECCKKHNKELIAANSAVMMFGTAAEPLLRVHAEGDEWFEHTGEELDGGGSWDTYSRYVLKADEIVRSSITCWADIRGSKHFEVRTIKTPSTQSQASINPPLADGLVAKHRFIEALSKLREFLSTFRMSEFEEPKS